MTLPITIGLALGNLVACCLLHAACSKDRTQNEDRESIPFLQSRKKAAHVEGHQAKGIQLLEKLNIQAGPFTISWEHGKPLQVHVGRGFSGLIVERWQGVLEVCSTWVGISRWTT